VKKKEKKKKKNSYVHCHKDVFGGFELSARLQQVPVIQKRLIVAIVSFNSLKRRKKLCFFSPHLFFFFYFQIIAFGLIKTLRAFQKISITRTNLFFFFKKNHFFFFFFPQPFDFVLPICGVHSLSALRK
jgi:hypothetical protein